MFWSNIPHSNGVFMNIIYQHKGGLILYIYCMQNY